MLDIGTLPGPAPGISATLMAALGLPFPVRLELGASAFLDQDKATPPGQSGRFSLRAFDAGACTTRQWGRVEVGACADVEVAWILAEGLQETVPSRGNAVWPVLRARATASYRLSSAWALGADVGGGYDVSQPEFVALGVGQRPIDQPERVTTRVALGMQLLF